MAKDIIHIKVELSVLAEQLAEKGFDIQLDYSVESVKEVEAILAAIHEDYAKTGSQEGLTGVAMEFAAYLVKVIERNFGPAKWTRDHSTLGKDTLPLQWRGLTLFPFLWCLKRITDGPSENIWSKFLASVILTSEKNAHDSIGNGAA